MSWFSPQRCFTALLIANVAAAGLNFTTLVRINQAKRDLQAMPARAIMSPPCEQGGKLEPGASCSFSLEIPIPLPLRPEPPDTGSDLARQALRPLAAPNPPDARMRSL